MAKSVQRRRGTTAEHSTFAGLAGEVTIDTDKKVPVTHDGSTAGGFPAARADQVIPLTYLDTDTALTADSDAKVPSQKAIKSYVDALALNLGKRQRVRAATTANITIATALNNADTLDGITLATGDLVLVKDQSAPAENGIYVVGVSPARASQFDTYNEHPGSLIVVAEGTANADTLWLCTSNDGGTINSTAIAFSQVRFAAASDTVSGIVELATSAEVATGSDTARAVTPAGVAANFIGQGYHEIGYWPARAMKPSATSGATALTSAESSSNKLNTEYLTFPNGSTTYAEFSFRAPKKLDPSALLYIEFEWMEASGASAHVCRWQAEAQAQGDGDTVDSAWGTAVAVDDTGSSGTRRMILTAAVTPAGSWAQGDKIIIRLARLGSHANDTLDVSAYLIGATVFASVNLKNDA